MRKFENYVQYTKYKVLKEVAHSTLQDSLEEDLLDIPEKIIPGPQAETRCCIYKERAIINERIKLAMKGDQTQPTHIEVIPLACDECPVDRYTVTEACRGCLAHKCKDVCPFGAISIVGQRAIIDPLKCRECGKCAEVCPFNAIAEVQRPCIRACEANAITYDSESKKASINEDHCVQCGACVFQCPFGAIMDQSYITNVIRLLKNKKDSDAKVYALIAPAISSQFTYARINQVVTGIKKLGFHSVIEVALGADLVAFHETKHLAKELPEKEWLTSSCCPAFVDYIEKNYPDYKDHISTAISPMIATARLVKKTDPRAKIVFIGPCIAKKMEQQKYAEDVDYVLTFEELQALLDAHQIAVEDCEDGLLDNASYFGRIFARSGGLSDAVTQAAKELKLDLTVTPVLGDGLKECDRHLKIATFNKLKGNFIEGMACKGGCICGPASLSHGPKDKNQVDKYGKLAMEKSITDSIRVLDINQVNLD
ncbi:4Fe-4S dicluster domain-containing protein [Vallitalea okinawensis]|uniref:4Fe-4S dicluster domain-containing protein n=1 Tax=Vallitalea okinawensis TaxID=2078660 RepID=UPI000CFE2845|nr:4Fe-4S dicluster domain-containing protein [Vallitalea okinawensis]